MEENKEDYIILKAGYDKAVIDILEILKDQWNYSLIKDRVLRKQKNHICGNQMYECKLSKYYDKENQLGYIIFDDIYQIKGIVIFIEENTCKEIDEKELIFINENYEPKWTETITNKESAEFKYNDLISKFK